jgi:hypothetical protein
MMNLSYTLRRNTTRAVAALAAVTLGGCSPLILQSREGPIPSTTRERAIFVDGNGRPLRVLTSAEHAIEKSDRQGVMSAAEYDLYLSEMVAAIRRESASTRRIMIVAHGGLNNVSTNLREATQLTDSIRKEGYYPILLIWDSSLRSTYREHLFYVRQGQVRSFNPVQGAFYLAADLGRGATRAPITWSEQVRDLAGTTGWSTPTWRDETHLLQRRFAAFPDSDEINIKVGQYNAGGREKVGRSLLTILTTPTKLIGGPLLDAVGASAWRNMQRRTRTMFHNPEEFGRSMVSANEYRAPSGAVAHLGAALDSMIRQDSAAWESQGRPGGTYKQWEIALVGHSMGAIVINEMVRHHYELPFRDIVYLAAACSIRDWEATVLPYLEENDSTRFYSLMLHPTVEARERNFGDVSPRGSLLEWIDDYMEDPETHVDRTMGKWANMAEATHLIPPGVRSRVYFRVFGYDDETTVHGDTTRAVRKPIKHTELLEPDVPFWSRDRFWWPQGPATGARTRP